MARNNNFLLGHGERLTKRVSVPSGGGEKNAPYTLERAKTRISKELHAATVEFDALPGDSAPQDEVVAIVTMHPRYVSKTDFPRELLSSVGLRTVGSRRKEVRPEAWGIEKHPETALTEQLFVAGKRSSFRRWSAEMTKWTGGTPAAQQLTHIENLSAFRAIDKLKGIPPERGQKGVLEVVIHNSGRRDIVEAFLSYAKNHQANPILEKRRDAQGLTFVPVEVDFDRAEELASFSFVRVARPLPILRPLEPAIARSITSGIVVLPTEGPLDSSFRAVVFDGGLPDVAITPLMPWVNYIQPAGLGAPTPDLQDHGLAVTASLLFGPIHDGSKLARPICPIDHVRVIDQHTPGKVSLDYIDVLDRITTFLDSNPGKYPFFNISLGPRIPIEDDDVNLWTLSLDDRLASGRAVATIAAGNDGHLDEASGRNRVQPPADGVNVVGVGATDVSGKNWKRADYSCVGPGRTPGYVKPDGVAYGGCDHEPFATLAARPGLQLEGTAGTSVASPLVLRSATAIRAQSGKELSPLAIRALLIHRANPGTHHRKDVGWGKFEEDPEHLITSEDDEALIVYQGNLPVGEHLRASIPLPNGPLTGYVYLTATLVIAPEIDPEHPGAYTRSGLEVAFRPNKDRFRKYGDGSKSKHPQTRSFFSASNLYGAAEYVLRDEHYKWEPCLRTTQRFRPSSLKDPCFDIYYHHREGATSASQPLPIPYALIVHLRAPKIQDLYNRIVRTYAKVLVPLQPKLRIQIQT